MAEYYPLLARAVAGLRDAPAAQRMAIYERARQALLGQLRSMQPAVPEESIQRESTALDEAIARVEAELRPAVDPAPSVAVPPPATPPPAEAPAQGPAPAPVQPPAQIPVPAPVAPPPQAAPPAPVVAPPAPTIAPPAPGGAHPPAMPPRATPARPAAEALSRLVAERAPVAEQAARPADEEGTGRRAPLPSAPRLEVPSFADALAAAGDAGSEGDPAEEGAAQRLAGDALAPARDEPARPPAPRFEERERFNPRMLILAGVACLMVAAIAYAAWRLRDKPEALARSRAAMLAAQQAEQQNPAKTVNRVDTGTAAPPPRSAAPAEGAGVVVTPPAATETPPAPAATAAAPTAPSAAPASTPATPAEGGAPAAEPASPPAATATPAPPAAEAGVPVAQRAALLVDAPDDPAKIKTYVGTAVWTAGTTTPAPGQPAARTVRADVEVPEAGLKLAMVFQKNLEPQFPASHTLELRFTIQPSSPVGTIKQINVPQMRRDDSPAGDALSGLPVTITDNYFLVGLQRGGDAVSRNLDLIRTRNWFDVPILLSSGKVAKITFEKGTGGAQLIDDTIASWQ